MRSSKEIPTYVAVTRDASLQKIKEMEKKGAKVLVIGGKKVNIINLFQHLEKLGFKKVLVEGGGEINWSVLKLGLVNELIVTIAPIVVGGRDAKTLVEGIGISYINDAIKMNLVKSSIQDKKEIVLVYRL
jgi:2,5-diamino-6-(ribosylamino)-4(3H)-pyrimidinone 5'-phosphate reductase